MDIKLTKLVKTLNAKGTIIAVDFILTASDALHTLDALYHLQAEEVMDINASEGNLSAIIQEQTVLLSATFNAQFAQGPQEVIADQATLDAYKIATDPTTGLLTVSNPVSSVLSGVSTGVTP